jgi:ParB family transcriptional regulator, chromosome partitioning protein
MSERQDAERPGGGPSTMNGPARTERRGGLGRGLAALIPTGPPEADAPAPSRHGLGNRAADVVFGARRPDEEPGDVATTGAGSTGNTGDVAATVPGEISGEVAGAVYREVRIDGIRPNSRQPRQVFDEEALAELEHSIREFGLLQPIVVRELAVPEAGADGGPALTHELVMGERRWRAAQRVGLELIPAIVRHTPDDTLLRDALLENIHRAQLNPLEEAAAYQQLLTEFDVTHEQLADRIGRSRPAITNTIRLLRLPVAVQRRVAAGVLSAGHARALLGLEDPGAQEELAARIVAEGLSVRAAEEAVTLARGGTPNAGKRAPARKPMHAPGLQDLAERLSDTFDTRVKVELGQRKGRIVVEFGSVDDLERIARLMGRDPSSGS